MQAVRFRSPLFAEDVREGSALSVPIVPDLVIKAVAEHFRLAPADIVSHRRYGHLAAPRKIAMYLACRLTGWSLPAIGRAFGGKHHTTVLFARDDIASRLDVEPTLRAVLAELTTEIRRRAGVFPQQTSFSFV